MTTHKKIQLLPDGSKLPPAAERARRLMELADAMDARHAFRPGQIVRWKPGLRNRTWPAYGEVCIVREVLAVPVFEAGGEISATRSYFREPLTLVLGMLDDDSDLVEFYYDARRFEPTG